MTIRVRFMPDAVEVDAEPGELMLQVAERAGVRIPTGCLMGSCHACEVEIEGGPSLCSCISAIPPDRDPLIINLFVDPSW